MPAGNWKWCLVTQVFLPSLPLQCFLVRDQDQQLYPGEILHSASSTIQMTNNIHSLKLIT